MVALLVVPRDRLAAQVANLVAGARVGCCRWAIASGG
jgi:hypothetical protein